MAHRNKDVRAMVHRCSTGLVDGVEVLLSLARRGRRSAPPPLHQVVARRGRRKDHAGAHAARDGRVRCGRVKGGHARAAGIAAQTMQVSGLRKATQRVRHAKNPGALFARARMRAQYDFTRARAPRIAVAARREARAVAAASVGARDLAVVARVSRGTDALADGARAARAAPAAGARRRDLVELEVRRNGGRDDGDSARRRDVEQTRVERRAREARGATRGQRRGSQRGVRELGRQLRREVGERGPRGTQLQPQQQAAAVAPRTRTRAAAARTMGTNAWRL